MAKPIFSFNLLPPRSESEVAKEENRSNSLLYASFLLFVITLGWLSIRLIDSAFVKRSLNNWNETQIQKKQEIDTYNVYASANGELVLKTRSLGPVVEKHIDPDFVFNFVDSLIKQTTPTTEILSYGRNSEGTFQVEGIAKSTGDISALVSAFNAEEQVEDARLNNLALDSRTNKYIFVLDIDLSNLSK